jgi:hypothetical protein
MRRVSCGSDAFLRGRVRLFEDRGACVRGVKKDVSANV